MRGGQWQSERGQVQQVFIFLTAVLVIGATAYLGVKLIGGLQDTACEADDVRFKQDVKELVDENLVFGSTNEAALTPPCAAVKLCFVDSRDIGSGSFTSEDPVIKNVVTNPSAVKTNIFLEGKKGRINAYDQRVLLATPDGVSPLAGARGAPLCLSPRGGKFRFRTEGYGRYVMISELS